MRIKRILIGFVIYVVMVFHCSPALSGGEGAPPAEGISGPELWGVVVIDCAINRASLRVKTIDNCVVKTEAFSVDFQTCPATANDPLWYKSESSPEFQGMGIVGKPIITKVKNFNVKGNIVSFDAQIRSTP